MHLFKADLHIHTVLSPCADLEMSPSNIVERAKQKDLKIIGITDHNSTLNCMPVSELAASAAIMVLCGAEVTTKEEVHVLCYFETTEQLSEFQVFIDKNINRIPNMPEKFGYQPVVDASGNILKMVEWWLPASINKSIGEIQSETKRLNGIFIPAHIDRYANGIISQLGFLPVNLSCDALEVSLNIPLKKSIQKYVIEHKTAFIRGSDAHNVCQIGEVCTRINSNDLSFKEIKKALKQQDNCLID